MEFALVALPLVTLSFGLIEFARVLYIRHEVAYAVGEASRAMSLDPTITQAALETVIVDSSQLISADNLTVAAPVATTIIGGIPVRTITVTYDIDILVPFIGVPTMSVEHARDVVAER